MGIARPMRVHPDADGSPKVGVLIAEVTDNVDVVFELQELDGGALLLPCDVVVQLERECRIGFGRAAAEDVDEWPLGLVEVAEGRGGGVVARQAHLGVMVCTRLCY